MAARYSMRSIVVCPLLPLLGLAGMGLAQTEPERIAKLEAAVAQLAPLVQQVAGLRVQLATMKVTIGVLDTKLNWALGLLGAIGLAILAEVIKRVPQAPVVAGRPSRLTREQFDELREIVREAAMGAAHDAG